MKRRARFAPSPTGRLHAGHALSALIVWDWAKDEDAEVLLRIEDIDHLRCRPEYDAAILDDLSWLGFLWPEPVLRQSSRIPDYKANLERLKDMGLLYPCFCTRPKVKRNALGDGHEGPVYGGTCRALSPADANARMHSGEDAAWRLKLDEALARAGEIAWPDADAGLQNWNGEGWGDIVIARKDIGVSYHIAVTTDDAAQGVTDVIRGMDLFHATHIHVLLQKLLGWDTPTYRHHRLIMDGDGVKLSKRNGAESLREIAVEMGGREKFLRHLRKLASLSS